MDPFSAIASAIAVYQLSSMVGNECVQYARGVQNAEKDGDIVIGELVRFKKSLLNLKGMLAEDEEDKGNTSRSYAIQACQGRIQWSFQEKI